MAAPEGSVFVRAVMKDLGLAKPSELARRLEMPAYGDAPGLVRKWLRGANEPHYRYTMAMLEEAGWLTAAAKRSLAAARAEAEKADVEARRLADGMRLRGRSTNG